MLKRRLARSLLHVSGINQQALDKLHGLACDAAMLDLEDGVSPLKKTQARAMVCAAARNGYGPRKEIAIRINALDSIWGHDDLAHAVDSGAHAVVVPKVASAEALLEVATKMDDHGAPKDMALWAMIETPLGVLNVHSIARSGHPRLACLVAGTFDLANELQCTATPCRHALVPSLAQIVLAARAYNLICLDGVHLDLDNATEFALQLKQGKEMGFHGKTLLHPETIDATNAMFSPSLEEIDHAHAIIQAFDAAIAAGDGMAVYNGKLVENLHVELARATIAIAEQIQDQN